MIVTLTPNPSLDRTLFLDTFIRGAVNRCSATLVEPSGKGINAALALHSHGIPARALFPSGGPAGEQLVQNCCGHKGWAACWSALVGTVPSLSTTTAHYMDAPRRSMRSTPLVQVMRFWRATLRQTPAGYCQQIALLGRCGGVRRQSNTRAWCLPG